ncbi:MAG: LacI family DNA-binding transcriptional regulator [Anaerolineae bacterium]|nr:LacI family DNA-binding transcriptional regulator [Anaerolineae bacterium]MDW7991860.1 LacI family DNA-binding transcriptional regulator [Anaerolineae bacterium]
MPRGNSVTIREVARRAGVSIATVSYVLNESAPISEETRARVLAAAAELGYRPSALARGLRARQSHTIGYSWHHVPRDRWHPILDPFLYSIAQAAEAEGYHILTFAQPADGDPWRPYQELMLTGRVDGFILSETNRDDPRIRYLLDHNFPFVAFGRANEEWDFPYVDVDNAAGTRMAVEHLTALGHWRIAVIAWPEDSLTGSYRLQGYLEGMAAAGLSVDPEWIVRTEHSEAAGRQAMQALLALPPDRRPTAVVTMSDLMAIGAMNALYEAGLQPGRDVSIVGFDDVPMAQYLRPPLTTLRQPIAEVGAKVVEMLLRLIRGEPLPERRVLLMPRLIVRESSGPHPSSGG